ncbi:uncharacterized protein VP01_8412g1 [Puccinia sorghi]|uniref:Uncharacterized protein n=1 Tax=Puccinia sorghi TaxID=27349 RepID=A0A0L6U9D9_9BASI|nr:uncharacterized protein VP01_8412g1 [Puccinia sorghi]
MTFVWCQQFFWWYEKTLDSIIYETRNRVRSWMILTKCSEAAECSRHCNLYFRDTVRLLQRNSWWHSSSQREARPRPTYHCVGKMALSLKINRNKLSFCSRAPLTCLLYPQEATCRYYAHSCKLESGQSIQSDRYSCK